MRLRAIRWTVWLALLPFAACAPAPEDDGFGTESQGGELAALSSPLELAEATELARVPMGRAALASEVRTLVFQERFAEAREILETRLADDPADIDATLLLTAVDLLDEEYEAAHMTAQTWLEWEPGELRLLERRAMASLLAHDVETAKVDYQELIEALGRAEQQAKLCEPLTQCCHPVAARIADAKVGLATAHYNLGQLDHAEELARGLLAQAAADATIDPTAAHFVLALSASKRGELDRALALYEAVLEMAPGNAATLNNIGGIYYQKKDLDRALEYFVAAYENAGMDRRGAAIAWNNVAEVSMLRGQLADAEDKLLEAADMSPRFAGTYFQLGVLYDLLGDERASAANFRMGLRLDEQGVTRWNTTFFTPEWEAHFAALLSELDGDFEAARVMWEDILDGNVEALIPTAQRHLRGAVRVGEALTAR
jgi:tetratricopeptide (TPR) repeat protein